MITQSGCFGSQQPRNEVIDSVEEVSSTVDDIMETPSHNEGSSNAAFMLMQHYAFMEQRVRLLTWAVVALAAVVLMKEL